MRRLAGCSGTLAALALVACSSAEVAPDPPCDALRWDGRAQPAGIVLVVSDTLRADALGVYGGSAATPAFDAFARGNLWFPHAFSQAPWTKPSVATLFTGLYPSQHGVTSIPDVMIPFIGERAGEAPSFESDGLAAGFVTLAEVLHDAGFRTGALVTNPWLAEPFGFGQGFDHYEDSLAAGDFPAEELSRAALAWLDAAPDDAPFFLYVHYMDAHRPYLSLRLDDLVAHAGELEADPTELPPPVRRAISRVVPIEGGLNASRAGVPVGPALVALAYRGGVERFDRGLGLLLAGLEERDPEGRTALIVTSDHGEALYTRGYGNHGRGLYDDELAVPLAMRLPGVTADAPRVGCTAGVIDLMPTLCAWLGLDCARPLHGRSLIAAPDEAGVRADRYLVSEGVGNQPHHRAVRGARHKLLHEPGVRPDGRPGVDALFDWRVDPGERRDLLVEAPDAPATTRALAALAEVMSEAVEPFDAPESRRVEVDASLAERLQALGYLGEPHLGEAPAPAPGP